MGTREIIQSSRFPGRLAYQRKGTYINPSNSKSSHLHSTVGLHIVFTQIVPSPSEILRRPFSHYGPKGAVGRRGTFNHYTLSSSEYAASHARHLLGPGENKRRLAREYVSNIYLISRSRDFCKFWYRTGLGTVRRAPTWRLSRIKRGSGRNLISVLFHEARLKLAMPTLLMLVCFRRDTRPTHTPFLCF
jgi:hypothetical protein